MSASRLSLLGATALLLAPFATNSGYSSEVPGWRIAGSAAEKYVAFVDRSVVYDGFASAGLTAQTDVDEGDFGTLMQTVDARPHIGQRMRLSAYVRTAGASASAAMWMRVDGLDGQVLGFDNMSRRGQIYGSQPWSEIEVILDVPNGSKAIAFGILLAGEGMVWIDSVSFDPVTDSDSTTGYAGSTMWGAVPPDDLPQQPTNLNFED